MLVPRRVGMHRCRGSRFPWGFRCRISREGLPLATRPYVPGTLRGVSSTLLHPDLLSAFIHGERLLKAVLPTQDRRVVNMSPRCFRRQRYRPGLTGRSRRRRWRLGVHRRRWAGGAWPPLLDSFSAGLIDAAIFVSGVAAHEVFDAVQVSIVCDGVQCLWRDTTAAIHRLVCPWGAYNLAPPLGGVHPNLHWHCSAAPWHYLWLPTIITTFTRQWQPLASSISDG